MYKRKKQNRLSLNIKYKAFVKMLSLDSHGSTLSDKQCNSHKDDGCGALTVCRLLGGSHGNLSHQMD